MGAKEFSPGAIAEISMEWAAKIAKMVENLGNFVVNLSSLEDVSLNHLEAGDILQYNGSEFVNVKDDVVGFRFFEDNNIIQCSYGYSDIVSMIDNSVEIIASYNGSNCVEYKVNEDEDILFKFISFVDGNLVVDNIVVANDDEIVKESETYELTPIEG